MTNKKVWRISIAASILLVAGVFIALFGAGFHLYTVKTPSMGTTAPVGTLVAVHAKDSYAIGDVVSYARNGVVYTHRIVDVTNQGFITKGDINGAPDALPVSRSEIVGSVTFAGKYLGFLVEALPWLLIGGAVVYGLSILPRIGRPWRWHFRIVGWSLVTSLVALWFRPWVNMVMTGYVAQNNGVAMRLINTGIFPVSVLGKVLTSGQDAVVTQTVADASGHYVVTPQLALNSWYFLLLLVICLTPVLAALLIGVEQELPAAVPEAVVTTDRRRLRYRRVAPIALTVTATVVAVALVLQMSTNAAFAASIKNSTNTAGTRAYFSCKNAVSTNAYLAWALGTSGTMSETDLSPNGRTGAYKDNTVTTKSAGCNQDLKASVTFNGTTQCLYESANYDANYHPDTFSLEAWFKTGAKSGGVIIGFGATRDSPVENNWDRHIYLDKDGRIVFGVYPAAVKIVYSSATAGSNGDGNYADSKWHHVIATLSAAGQSLYVDGKLAMTNTAVTAAEGVPGYWKVGCGKLLNWQNAATAAKGDVTNLDYSGPSYFNGQIQYAAVYSRMLTETEVLQHYQAGAA